MHNRRVGRDVFTVEVTRPLPPSTSFSMLTSNSGPRILLLPLGVLTEVTAKEPLVTLIVEVMIGIEGIVTPVEILLDVAMMLETEIEIDLATVETETLIAEIKEMEEEGEATVDLLNVVPQGEEATEIGVEARRVMIGEGIVTTMTGTTETI